jgi:prepilin-type N-terminal cleavage/methylation domain-containing protein
MTAVNAPKAPKRSAGFSLMEVSVVVLIVSTLAATTVPQAMQTLRTYRLSGDARGLAYQLSLARLRAGSDFTWAQIVLDTSATPNSYSLQLCTTKATSSCTTFTTEGGTQYLSSGISLGFGLSSGPAGGQTTAQQTTQVTLNSRGIPIDSGGSPTANDTIYLADDKGDAYAVSVTLSGHPKIWRYRGGSWVSL